MVSLHTNKTETKATTLKDRPHDQLLMTNTKELHGIFVDFFFKSKIALFGHFFVLLTFCSCIMVSDFVFLRLI